MDITYHRQDLFAAVDKLSQLEFEGKPMPRVFIPHVVNNMGVMGAGFVVPLKKKWPEVEKAYLNWYAQGDHGLGQIHAWTVESNVTVINMVAQTLDKTQRPLSYSALGKCLEDMASHIFDKSNSEIPVQIHAPMFGAGLAGGDWNIIKALIGDAFPYVDVHIYFLEGQAPKGFAIDSNGNQVCTNTKIRNADEEGLVEEIISDTQIRATFNGEERFVDPVSYSMI